MLAILGDGFGQSIDMVADALGVALDADKRTTHEMAVTTVDLDTPVGVIEAGTVAAQRFTWEGIVDGEPFMTVRVNWLMGEEHLDPAWTFGPEGERFEVEFDADPPLKASFHGMHPPTVESADLDRNEGILATAMHCVNAIPYVVDAEPGIRTYLDLPLMPGRAAGAGDDGRSRRSAYFGQGSPDRHRVSGMARPQRHRSAFCHAVVPLRAFGQPRYVMTRMAA